jgi:hypothetical protein
MFKRKKPRQKQQEEEQQMYPPHNWQYPTPGYGYPPPYPPPPQPTYIVMPPPPPPPKKGGRKQQNDWMEDLQEQYWKDFRKKIEKADEKPKPKQFSTMEVMFFLTFGSMIIFPIQVFIVKSLVTLLKVLPY